MKFSSEIERVAIDRIQIGVRRRKKLGNLKSLARSIETHDLLHPILLRNGHELVTGQRRLEACRLLGWKTVPARHIETLSDDELRAVELEENTERLDLLDYETSKARLAEIRQAEVDAKTREEDSQVSRGARGPAREPGSRRDVAAKTGIAPAAQRNLEKHVAAAERYPLFKRPEWRQYHVIEADAKLGVLKDSERHEVTALLDQPGIPPKQAIGIIENLTSMPAPQRRAILTKAKSKDEMERRTALTEAARLPPPPDPGLLILDRMARDARKAEAECRIPGAKPLIRALRDRVDQAVTKVEALKAKAEKT